MQLCFFEDHLLERFHPITLTRPIDDLRIGILTIGEKWEAELSAESTARLLRPELEGLFDSAAPAKEEPVLWINSRYLPEEHLQEKVVGLDTGSCLRDGSEIIAAKVDGGRSAEWLSEGKPDFNSLLVAEIDSDSKIEHLWDLFLINSREIAADIRRLGSPKSDNNDISSHAVLEYPEQIYIDEGATIEPGVILIAEEGPIYIGKNATINAGSMIRGAAAVGRDSFIKMDAKIYEGTTIGPVCKASGEINNSIMHSYSNKAHEGYLGNSIIGQWCNVGADSNTSNLKNNYSAISMTDWNSRKPIDTGQMFLGTIMGDHTKTAINVQFNAGTVCGVCCNIFTTDFPPKFMPSFSWVGTNVIMPYKLDKALETMKIVMKRRNVDMTDSYRELMEHLFKASRH